VRQVGYYQERDARSTKYKIAPKFFALLPWKTP